MSETDIAIVGMAAHVPGGPNPTEFWRSLCAGEEQVRELTDEELIAAGVPRDVIRRPGYVRATVPLDGVYDFDADFFGLSPKEAGVMDPQQRHFLMAVWEALEDAGHVPDAFDGAIGLFAGVGQNSYYVRNLLTNDDLVDDVGLFLLRHTGNDKDFLTTRASYILDLRGPSVNVQTACSTSLVATHLAVQHLLSGECDLALAGGVTIEIPHGQGYQYHEGEVLSPDGHCRAFDHNSKGTVFGSGVGIVALRRLDDALADGDRIYAVIKGTAVNNDGAQKVGYLAPSVDGQSACVTEALAVADVDPRTIGYVECHGTGTPMGDPIEIAALTQAFRAATPDNGFCRIGSVKTNIGHLDTAAGVVGLIKAALAVHHGVIPPSLNFERPNPALQLETTPFVVNDQLHEWANPDGSPRRAAVNSLGVGGTNAFVVLEEPPTPEPVPPSEPDQLHLLRLSARTRPALDALCAELAEHLRSQPDIDISDVAWSLHRGRRDFDERLVLVASDIADAVASLEDRPPQRVFTHTAGRSERHLTFMFPGGGTQHAAMAASLHATVPAFAAHLDAGMELLAAEHGVDLRPLLLPTADSAADAELALEDPVNQLPAIFLVQHSLAQTLIGWGVEPTSLVGYSLGENTAACIAGTMSFPDCLSLVALRGRLVGDVEGGALAVPLSERDAAAVAEAHGLDIAILNGPELTVVSGPEAALTEAEASFRAAGAEPIRIALRAAAHSRLLDPVLDEFRSHLRTLDLRPPSIPWVSNRSGTWITDAQATDPEYWVDHLRHTVRFSDCIETLAEDPGLTLVEIGPRRSLSSIVRAHPALKVGQVAVPMMRHPDEDVDDRVHLLTGLGRLWAAGGELPREPLLRDTVRRRITLPTYPFQTQPFKIEPGERTHPESEATSFLDREPEDRWWWTPVWRSQDAEEPVEDELTWLVIVDQTTIEDGVVERLRARGDRVVIARCGDSYRAVSDTAYVIAPELGGVTYENLVRDLVRTGYTPDRIAHLGLLASDESGYRPGSSFFHRNQELGFQSLVLLAQAWASADVQRPLHVVVATMGSQRALPSDRPRWPEQATVLGPALVIPREFADVTVTTVDVEPGDVRITETLRDRVERARSAFAPRSEARTVQPQRESSRDRLVHSLTSELLTPAANAQVALRGERRLVADVRRVQPPEAGAGDRLRQQAAVLITGGTGGIGLSVAESLIDSHAARVALMSRSQLPDRAHWDELLERLGPDHPTAVRLRRIRSLEARGASVLLVQGDVTDVQDVERVVEEVRSRFGRLDAVVHAAGVVDDNLIVAKPQTDMDDVLAPKVYGTLVLEEATRADDLDLFVVFTSTSAHSAPVGQADYVAANSFLNAWAGARRAAGADHVLALGWGVWRDVGMAAAASDGDTVATEVDRQPATHPFFESASRDHTGRVRLTSRWNSGTDWFLDDHRTAEGTALLPGTGYVELARGALHEVGEDRPFELRGLTFLRPLVAAEDRDLEVETTLRPTDEGYEMVVRERVAVPGAHTEGGPIEEQTGWRRTAEASILLHPQGDLPRVDLAAVAAACPQRLPTRTPQQDFLHFGPRWDVVERVQRGSTDAVAWLRLDDRFAQDLDQIGIHPGLLDLATGFAMDLIDGYTGSSLWVPIDYQRVRVLDRLPQEIVAIAQARATSSESSGFAVFDVTICAPDGEVLLVVNGFTIKRLEGGLEVNPERVLASELEHEGSAPRATSRSELVFRHNLSIGIGTDEGRRAFEQAIAYPGDVVYVSSIDLHGLRRQSEAAAAEQLGAARQSSAVFARPELESDLVEPRNDVEETLVVMWEDLLGIDKVGVRDSFFDLGGHSLIAVRLFANVKRTFGVEFPISILFEAPTIEDCARLIAEALPTPAADEDRGEEPSDEGERGTIAVARPRFRHLVAMHPGDGGPKTPFFLVAGMFGNVLNLRHLAHLIGTDRPFYGVQARGIYGDEAPHDDFIEMAETYVEELQDAQPRGPYLLGGFSGGGITALEMARILEAKGETVDLLVMLDTPVPTTSRDLTTSEKISLHLGQLRREGPAYIARWATSRIRWEREVRRRRRGPAVPAEEGALHSQVVVEGFYRALDRYEMRYWPGTIRQYRPKLTPLHVFGPDRQIDIDRRFIYHDNGWGEWCDRVDVTEVPGNHDSMVLEPNVRVLAAHIRADIDRLEDHGGALPGVGVSG